MKNTLFIVDDCQANLKFFTKTSEKGYAHLNRVYVGLDDNTVGQSDEVNKLLNSDQDFSINKPTPLSTTMPKHNLYDEIVIIGYIP